MKPSLSASMVKPFVDAAIAVIVDAIADLTRLRRIDVAIPSRRNRRVRRRSPGQEFEPGCVRLSLSPTPTTTVDGTFVRCCHRRVRRRSRCKLEPGACGCGVADIDN